MPWKFLDPSGCTYFNGKPFVYNLPGRNEKWALTEHPEPAVESGGEACGPGGLHLKKSLDSEFAPVNWWPWYARPAGVLLGQGNEKMRLTAVELRRVDRRVFHRCLRPPFNWGMNANLRNANLTDANLTDANLWNANLWNANLMDADLRNANLMNANLRNANLWNANLTDADLRGADLRNANLMDANLRNADLRGAKWNKYTRWPEGFTPPQD